MFRFFKSFWLITLLIALQGCQAYVDGESRTLGEKIDDTQIKATIKRKLIADNEVKGLKIAVRVSRGEVELSGRVPSEYARGKAKQIAAEVRGVGTVIDKLTIVD